MATKNDITGDSIRSKINNKTGYDAYRDGWERIFGDKNVRRRPTQDGNQNRKSRTS